MRALHPQGEVLVVIGSGTRAMREPVLRRAAARCPLWLVDDVPPTWQGPHVVGWSVDPLDDPESVARLLTRLPVSAGGVLTFLEEHVELVAVTARALGLPGPSPESARACRDKATTRRVLSAAGVPQPRVGLARSVSEAVEVAAGIVYPVVVKPRNLGGSLGVRKAETVGDLADAFAAAHGASAPGVPDIADGVLVEEYLAGPEISVDSAVRAGDVVPLVIAHKTTGPEPWFEEVGHAFDADDPLFSDAELLAPLGEVHRALGLDQCVTHSEWRLTDAGPRLVEVNLRLGGQLIPHVGACQGVDAVAVACDLARGLVPDLVRRPVGAGRVHFLYPEQDVRLTGLSLAGGTPEGVEVEFTARAGDVLRLPPAAFQSRYGHAVVRGRDPAQVDARLAELHRRIHVTGEPLVAAAPLTI